MTDKKDIDAWTDGEAFKEDDAVDMICGVIGKGLSRILILIGRGFFLATGALLAWGLYNYLALVYTWG